MNERLYVSSSKQNFYEYILRGFVLQHSYRHLFQKTKQILKLVDDNSIEEIEWILTLTNGYLKTQQKPNRTIPTYLDFVGEVSDQLKSENDNIEKKTDQVSTAGDIMDCLFSQHNIFVIFEDLRRKVNLSKKICITALKVFLQ